MAPVEFMNDMDATRSSRGPRLVRLIGSVLFGFSAGGVLLGVVGLVVHMTVFGDVADPEALARAAATELGAYLRVHLRGMSLGQFFGGVPVAIVSGFFLRRRRWARTVLEGITWFSIPAIAGWGGWFLWASRHTLPPLLGPLVAVWVALGVVGLVAWIGGQIALLRLLRRADLRAVFETTRT